MRLLRLGLVGLLLPGVLAAQDQRLAERLDPTTATAVQLLVDSAGQAGLPTEPLVQKALEGSTLGASGDRIHAAVTTLVGQLGRARDALGGGADGGEGDGFGAAHRGGRN
ncbi:MAG: hypothetical protein H0T68_08135 [Gemmatimonadales bacterium]|nr:hypothetical protein [Gemmatimonadales bacterium]